MKTCSKCGEVKALDAFYADSRKDEGKRSECKSCTSTVHEKYRKTAQAKINARSRAWKKDNRDKVSHSGVKYYKANSEKAKARQAVLRVVKRDVLRAKGKRDIATLAPSYVADLIGIPVAALTPELLAIKREQLETYRLAKQLRQATKEEHASI